MTLHLPSEALPYILLQRTAYTLWGKSRPLAKVINSLPSSVHYSLIRWESRMRAQAIATAYSDDMAREYQALKPYLPNDATALLDIGCGIGGINVFLFEHYQRNPNLKFFLLDKSDIAPQLYYGFKQRGAFYNSLEITRQLLESHHIPVTQIHTLEATPTNDIPIETPLDLVISLISWGFHYPISTYLERVHTLLKPKGRLILDLRPNTNGIAELKTFFPTVEVIPATYDVCQRVLAIKE